MALNDGYAGASPGGAVCMGEERFSRSVVDVLAKRAANTCSNPECGAVTAGPAEEQDRAIIVGEAAHIYGARPGSARFDKEMHDSDRSDITNGIWLCRNCHKIVDVDRNQYPAELLFEWRRAHESAVLERLGKAGTLKQKVIERRLEGFESCSYLSQQIIIDKPDFWEYKLTAELLRVSLGPIRKRWKSLEQRHYALPVKKLSRGEALSWFSTAINDTLGQTAALNGLLNGELQASWRPPGEPGSEHEILRVCGLLTEACQRLLEWEERVRFVSAEEPFEEFPELLSGACGPNLAKVCELSNWLSSIFEKDPPDGRYEMRLVFDLPNGWNERIDVALRRAERRFSKYF
jgi:hypothetical protein